MEKVRKTIKLSLSIIGFVFLSSCSTEVLFDFDAELQEDIAQIDQYLIENNITAERHPTHARYRIIDNGIGPVAEVGDTVTYLFSVYNLDNLLLVSNQQEVLAAETPFLNALDTARTVLYDPDRVQIFPEYTQLIPALTPEGGQAEIFVPSYLAYGFSGNFSNSDVWDPFSPVMIFAEVLAIDRR